MPANSVLDSFIRTYSPPTDRTGAEYKYPTFVRHKGTVIAFVMDDRRKIYYSVLNPDSAAEGWSETPIELIFPTEIAQVGFGALGQTVLPVFKKSSTQPEPPGAVLPPFNSRDEKTYDYFLSTTARFSSDAPFQVLSDGQYVYVFRQALSAADLTGMIFVDSDDNLITSKDGTSAGLGYVDATDTWHAVTVSDAIHPLTKSTLLVDRFILIGNEAPASASDGASNAASQLQGKLEVRYQRSRKKTSPMDRKDTLGARDLNGNLFYEPTQELGFVNRMKMGRFTVLLLPTQVANESRWQIFTQSASTGRINSFNIARSADGLFNTRGSQIDNYTKHPYGGAMLYLGLSGYVKLSSNPALTDGSFSQEAWIYFNYIDMNPGTMSTLFASKGNLPDSLDESRRDANTGPSIWVMQKKVCVGFGNGSKWFEYTSPELLTLNAWHHLAVTFDGTNYCLYLDGELKANPKQWDIYVGGAKQSSGLLSGKPAAHPDFFGAKSNGFAGMIEEVRFWNRALSQTELKGNMHRRLIGTEPGLMGYWQFDEGTGTTIDDLTDNENNGTIIGNAAQWMQSTAPIGENAGVDRDTLSFQGRDLASGLTALLYFRQAKSGSGYSGEEKPLKQEARVLLATATTASPAAAGDKQYIGVLDFGLSSTGRLAQIPNVVPLSTINAPQQTNDSLNKTLNAASILYAQVAPLQAQVDAFNAQIKTSNDSIQDWSAQRDNLRTKLTTATGRTAERIQSAIDSLAERIKNERKLLAGYMSELSTLQSKLDPLRQQLDPLLSALTSGTQVPMNIINLDPAGLTVTGALLNFAWTQDTPRLFDSATGNVALYYRGMADEYFVAYYQSLNETSPNFLLDSAKHPLVMIAARSSDLSINPSPKFTLTITDKPGDNTQCTVTITGGSSPEILNGVPRFAIDFINTFKEKNGPASQYIYAALTDVAMHACDIANTTVSLTGTAPATLVDASNKPVAKIVVRQKVVAIQGAAAQDTCDVTIISGNITETWNKVPRDPSQFVQILSGRAGDRRSMGNGQVNATISQNSQKYGLSLDTPLSHGLRVGDKLLMSMFVKVQAASEATQDHISIRFIGDPPSTIPSYKFAVMQADNSLGNGTIGQVAGDYELDFDTPLSHELEVGDRLSLSLPVTVQTAAAVGALQIDVVFPGTPPSPLPAWQLAVTADPIYNYQDCANTTQFPNTLHAGSSLLMAVPISELEPDLPAPAAASQIDNQVLCLSLQPCQWTGNLPGTTLSLDGIHSYAGTTDATQVGQTDVTGDLTLEAWVKPGQVPDANERSIIKHHSSNSDYSMGVNLRFSALQFDGQEVYVNIPNSTKLNFAGAITIEAWIRLGSLPANGQMRNIVAHEFNPNSPNTEVHLRIIGTSNSAQYQFGSRDNTDHVVSMSVPVEDTTNNQWVHLAGVYDLSSQTWYLYRNGKLGPGASLHDTVGAVQVDADWAIGARAKVPTSDYRVFKGAIDDVRIWNCARTATEIEANMHRRLTGTEQNLVGYWYADGGVIKDHTATPSNGAVYKNGSSFSTPLQLVESPVGHSLIAGVKGKYAIADNLRFGSGSWNHFAAVLKKPSALQFDGPQNYLDAGNGETLNIVENLTIEAFLTIADVNHSYGILSRGNFAGGGGPYALAIQKTINSLGGKLLFSFQDTKGQIHTFTSTATLQPGTPYKVAVRRRTKTKSIFVPGTAGPEGLKTYTFRWSEIDFFVGGQKNGTTQYYLYYDGENSFANILQVYNDAWAEDTTNLAKHLRNLTNYPYDFLAPNISTSNAAVEIGRVPVAAVLSDAVPTSPDDSLPFRGSLSQVRLWRVALDDELVGQEVRGTPQGLVAWWKFSEGNGNEVADYTRQNNARIKGAPNWIKDPDPSNWELDLYRNGEKLDSSKTDDPQPGNTQFTLGAYIENTGGKGGFFKGELEEVRVWNVARTPQQILDNLFGRLQGDSENLVAYYTFDADLLNTLSTTLEDLSPLGNHLTITDASPVYSTAPLGQDSPQVRNALAGIVTPFSGLIQSQPDAQEYGELQYDSRDNLIGVFKRCYTYILNRQWQLITGFKVGDIYTEWVGQTQFAPQLYGFIEGAPPLPAENFDEKVNYTGASSVKFNQADKTVSTYAASRNTGLDMSLEGSITAGVKDKADVILGPFIKKATEVEATAGVRGTFEDSKNWLESATVAVGQQKARTINMDLRGQLNPDTNNFVPANKGLALVKSSTADVFALRLRSNNALISFQMLPNPDIPEDWNLIIFPIDPHYTKQGTLDGKLSTGVDPDYPNAMKYSPDISYFKPIEAYRLKNQIDRDETELQMYFEQYEAGAIGRTDRADPAGTTLTTTSTDPILRSSLMSGLSSRATNLQYLQNREQNLAKRNLINTYVWTADGGFFAETSQTMDSLQEQIGGSYKYKWMAGFTLSAMGNFGGLYTKAEFKAMFGAHIDVTVNKAKNSETSFSVDVNLNGFKSNIYDNTGKKVAGKVDAYRFMSFFLAPDNKYHDQFFNKVVDPEWLYGDEPGARALLQARDDTRRPACWRLMHRVTYVSRVLPDKSTPASTSLEQDLQKLDIDSNYELIKSLEPYVANHLGSYAEFSKAVDEALTSYLPGLVSHAKEIKRFLSLYFALVE